MCQSRIPSYHLPHQLWGSIPLYTPDLEPSSLYLHLLYSSLLSIFVIHIRHISRRGGMKNRTRSHKDCKTVGTYSTLGRVISAISPGLQNKQVQINHYTESMRGNILQLKEDDMKWYMKRTEIRDRINTLSPFSRRLRACSALSQAFDVPPWDLKA